MLLIFDDARAAEEYVEMKSETLNLSQYS